MIRKYKPTKNEKSYEFHLSDKNLDKMLPDREYRSLLKTGE